MGTDSVIVVEMTEEEQNAASLDALEWCGHTYDELEEMSRDGHFDTFRSRHVWLVIGGMRPPEHAVSV